MAPLHVLLQAPGLPGVEAWLALNFEWLATDGDLVSAVIADARGTEVQAIDNLAEALTGGAGISGPSFAMADGHAALQERSRGRELLVTGHRSVARPDWRAAVERACGLARCAAATGRWMVPAPDEEGEAGDGEGKIDQMPARIAPSLLAWSFSHEMHGAVARRLPMEFLWVSSKEAPRFLAGLRAAGDIKPGAKLFFDSIELERGSRCLYLPDIYVYES